MGWEVWIALVVTLAVAYWLGGRKLGPAPTAKRTAGPKPARKGWSSAKGPVDSRGKPCTWKLRSPAQNGFEARWRCGRCGADVSAPESAPPQRCHRVGLP